MEEEIERLGKVEKQLKADGEDKIVNAQTRIHIM